MALNGKDVLNQIAGRGRRGIAFLSIAPLKIVNNNVTTWTTAVAPTPITSFIS